MRVPILKLRDILVTSIRVDLTDQDAITFRAELLEEMIRTEAGGVVMDISGLDVVDSFMARVLNDTVAGVRLLGAEVVLCGMRPAVAITLVEMGCPMTGVRTVLDLEQGLMLLRTKG